MKSQLPKGSLLAYAVIALMGALVLAPLLLIFYGSFRTASPLLPGEFTLDNYLLLPEIPWFWACLRNSVIIAALATALSFVFGVTLAFIIARTNTPLRGFFGTVAITALFVPHFGISVAWSSLMHPNSPLMELVKIVFPGIGGINMYSIWGIAWVLGLYYSVYFFLFTVGALQSMDPSLEEASLMCGASVGKTWIRITLPLIAPAILSAALLVFTLCVEAFTIPLILGWPGGVFTLSTKIFALMQFPPVNWNLAAVICTPLLAISVVSMYLFRKSTSRKKFTTVTGKISRLNVLDLGRARYLTLLFGVTYILLIVILPGISLALNSFMLIEWRFIDFPTLKNFSIIFSGMLGFWECLSNSLIVAFTAALFGILLSVIISLIIIRTKLPGRGVLDFLTLFPLSIPTSVMAVGIFWTFIRFPIYGTLWMLIIAYISRFLAYGLRPISSNLVQIHEELEESSRMSGGSWLQTIRHITVPLLKPGMFSGWLLLFATLFREMGIATIISTTDTTTLPVLMFQLFAGGFSVNTIYAMALIFVIILTVILLFFKYLFGVKLEQTFGGT